MYKSFTHRFATAVVVAAVLTGGLTGCQGPSSASKELAGQVEIRRTAYGVPHILAETEEAAAFGLAYCQAQDHLLNIMRSILRARGELTLHFGPGEEDNNLESDFWNRQYRVRARAEETYDRLDPDFRSMLQGFAAGLNYYVDLHREEVPDWVPEVSGTDIAAHGLTGVMRFAFNRGRVVESFLARQSPQTTESGGSGDSDVAGSNMWAFAPSRTTSGAAILMGNPHQPWSQVATYYEAHLTVPGKLNFYGSTFVGRPVLTTGFNDNLGWSHTVNYPDLEEIYELDRDPGASDHYLLDGVTRAMTRDKVTITSKTDAGTRVESRDFWHTDEGPVIHMTPEKVYVLKSAVYNEFRFYQQWLRLAQAQNFQEFRRALEIQAIPMFNLVYADREGNIFYLWNGTVPDLPHASHRDEAVPARSRGDMWTHFHPVDELPQLHNPTGGYVQNSNDPPYFTNLHEPLDIDSYPGHFPRHRLGLRTQHSLELIHNERKLRLEDVRDMKFSPRMLLADRVKDDLIKAVRAANPSSAAGAAAELLEQWDNTVTRESRGSVLFKVWWQAYSRPVGGETPALFAVEWSPQEPTTTPRGLADPERAVAAWVAAIEETESRYGTWEVSWGDVHRVRRGEVDLPVAGCSGRLGCFRVLSFRRDEDGKEVVRGGDSWVFTVEFGETPRAYSVVGYSQSASEASPHFSDQASVFAANEMKAVAFTEEEIEAQLLESYHPGQEATRGLD